MDNVFGKVVVIDDDKDDAFDLIKVLSQRNLWVKYYSGDRNENYEPITGLRIIFLDFVLPGTSGRSSNIVVGNLLSILRKIVSKKNGPFLIFAWTAREDYIQELDERLKKDSKIAQPCYIINMEKNSCKNSAGKIVIGKLEKKLKEKISELKIYHFFMDWERIVFESCNEVIFSFNKLISFENAEEWRKEINTVLYQLAQAFSGEDRIKKVNNSSHSTMYLLNTILNDSIDKNIQQYSRNHIIEPEENKISDDAKAILNTHINLKEVSDRTGDVIPGYLFNFKHWKYFEGFKEIYDITENSYYQYQRRFIELNKTRSLEKDEIKNLTRRCKPCLLEITAECDYANSNRNDALVIAGLIVPYELRSRIKPPRGHLITTPMFKIYGNKYALVFSTYLCKNIDFNKIPSTTDYQLRNDQLSLIRNIMLITFLEEVHFLLMYQKSSSYSKSPLMINHHFLFLKTFASP